MDPYYVNGAGSESGRLVDSRPRTAHLDGKSLLFVYTFRFVQCRPCAGAMLINHLGIVPSLTDHPRRESAMGKVYQEARGRRASGGGGLTPVPSRRFQHELVFQAVCLLFVLALDCFERQQLVIVAVDPRVDQLAGVLAREAARLARSLQCQNCLDREKSDIHMNCMFAQDHCYNQTIVTTIEAAGLRPPRAARISATLLQCQWSETALKEPATPAKPQLPETRRKQRVPCGLRMLGSRSVVHEL